jgi:predicted nucleic acid-binding protein
MKVFFDTNVWLSAVVFSGLCEELVLRCADSNCLFSSALVRIEAHEVLVRKFSKLASACDLFDASWQAAQLIADVDEPKDDNDRRLVTAAASAGMQWFVTGDKRVLSWQTIESEHGTLTIVSPRQAWAVVAA